MSNTVNMSTRIRIDIMKLISKRLCTSTETSYVQGFSSRPTLHYRMSEPEDPSIPALPPTPGTGRSYTFTECVERWGNLLTPGALEPVRRKASLAFRRCLEQYFVVLSDREPDASSEDTFYSRLFPDSDSHSGPPFHPRGGNRGGRRGGYRWGQRGSHRSRSNFGPLLPRGGQAPSLLVRVPRSPPPSTSTSEPAGTKRIRDLDDDDLGQHTPSKKREQND